MYSKTQKLVAEFLGTFAVVFFSAGAICADQFLRSSANGQPGIGPLGIALAYGLSMGVMVSAFSSVSGGHFNPAITIGLWVTRKFSTFDTLAYWAVQLAGSVCAGYALRRLPFDIWGPVQLGAPDLASGVTRTDGMIFEAIMTFFLVLVAHSTSMSEGGAFSKVAGFATGLTITVGVLFGGPFTGAALNPARAFGPAVAASHWTNHGVYWIGPLAGGVAAGWLHDAFFLRKS